MSTCFSAYFTAKFSLTVVINSISVYSLINESLKLPLWLHLPKAVSFIPDFISSLNRGNLICVLCWG